MISKTAPFLLVFILILAATHLLPKAQEDLKLITTPNTQQWDN